jgi:urease accessory protein
MTPAVATRHARSPAGPGQAALEVEVVAGESAVASAFASAPLKLLTPRARGRSAWAYASSFGGGLVAGDRTRLDVRIGRCARCFFGTQAATKVYRNRGFSPSGHVTRATLETDSLLTFLPDPVQAFADSTYVQRQQFHLAHGAGLALVDWFTSGRAARGERWDFNRFQSRNEVLVAGERVFLDSVVLDPGESAVASPHRVGRFNCFAMLLLLGPPLRAAAACLMEWSSKQPVVRRSSLVSSASPVRDGVVLRLAGEQVEPVGREIQRHLLPLSELLGDEPWSRKW